MTVIWNWNSEAIVNSVQYTVHSFPTPIFNAIHSNRELILTAKYSFFSQNEKKIIHSISIYKPFAIINYE